MTDMDATLAAMEAEAEDHTLTPGQVFRRRMAGHTGFLIGAGLILMIALVAIFAPLLAPHDPYVQSLSTRMMPPVWADGGSWDHLLGTD